MQGGFGGDLEDGEVVRIVGGDDLGGKLFAIEEDALDVGGLIDDVLIGDDVAGVVDDKPRAQRLCGHLAELGGDGVEEIIAGGDASGNEARGGDVDDGVLD